ncbi:MAG: amidase [Hyphomicrobiaceae bacterium]|jgi:amidase
MLDPYCSARELAKAIRTKKVDPLDVVDGYLERMDAINPRLNAVVWRRDEELRDEARELALAIGRGEELGPLAGVPIPIKDLTDVAGWPTTFGSRGAEGRIATETAHVAAALRDAGALLMCRTNTPEFGTVSVTENELFGATRNPYDLSRTPGGSSGGAAACVAAGLAPVAHANDGGGSIRMPASCCNLVGLKPSRGRVSSGPVICDVMHGGAVEGAVTRTVADTALILDAISGFDTGAWYNAPSPARPFLEEVGRSPGRLRVAFCTTSPTGGATAPECVEAVHAAARLLEGLGHEVFEGGPQWPDPGEVISAFLTVWNTGSAYWDVQDWERIEPLNAALRAQAAATNSLEYVKGLTELQAHSRRIVGAWGRDFDLLLTPTVATLPPPIGYLWETADKDPGEAIMRAAEMAPYTVLFNVTGQPAISLPLHVTDSGIPVGVQLVGAPWDEAGLIRISSQLEEAAGWADRHPDLA